MKRYKMNAKRSKRVFTRAAVRTSPKNTIARPMRGGFRL